MTEVSGNSTHGLRVLSPLSARIADGMIPVSHHAHNTMTRSLPQDNSGDLLKNAYCSDAGSLVFRCGECIHGGHLPQSRQAGVRATWEPGSAFRSASWI